MADARPVSPFLPPLAADDLACECLMDDRSGRWITRGELARLAGDYRDAMHSPRGLAFVFTDNDIDSVAAIAGALQAGHMVALLNPDLPQAAREDLTAAYEPDYVVDSRRDRAPARSGRFRAPLEGPADILLSTSGSTGSPKFVRLTLEALDANARAIGAALDIAPGDVAAGHLPLHYSFGMSTLTAHLVAGARVRLTGGAFTDRTFWPAMREAGVTHLPGVPFHFQMMQKLRFERLGLSDLCSLAQAGGFLDVAARRQAHDFMQARGGRFYVMYGQTEAGPRMTTLPHADFPAAPDSVGPALQGGRIDIRDPDADGAGEVVYHGPNVMLGYAETRADLSRGDENHGVLHTGDIGVLDEAGRLRLTGRLSRFAKLYGLRVSLDDIETRAAGVRESMVFQEGERLQVRFLTTGDTAGDETLKAALLAAFAAQYALPALAFDIRPIEAIPRTERGKIDYRARELSE